jgi:peptidoglycan/xylan/chitin deacetylase (PgdA/CDA1 family)
VLNYACGNQYIACSGVERLPSESISLNKSGARPRKLHFLYHEIRSCPSDYLYVVGEDQFREHAELFASLQNSDSSALYPEITFDDGHGSNLHCALPVLQSSGLRARFFITVGWTENKPGYMDWDDLRLLHEAGQSIGAHGWSHTLLTHCTRQQLDRELAGARQALEDKLGTSITTMSLPGGRYNREVLEACREAGYTQVFTSDPKAEPDDAAFLVGRLNVRGDLSRDQILAIFQPGGRVLSKLHRSHQIKKFAKMILGDGWYEKLWSILNRQEKDPENDEDESQ